MITQIFRTSQVTLDSNIKAGGGEEGSMCVHISLPEPFLTVTFVQGELTWLLAFLEEKGICIGCLAVHCQRWLSSLPLLLGQLHTTFILELKN